MFKNGLGFEDNSRFRIIDDNNNDEAKNDHECWKSLLICFFYYLLAMISSSSSQLTTRKKKRKFSLDKELLLAIVLQQHQIKETQIKILLLLLVPTVLQVYLLLFHLTRWVYLIRNGFGWRLLLKAHIWVVVEKALSNTSMSVLIFFFQDLLPSMESIIRSPTMCPLMG
jgi:hypothetical protein